jgi:hypothetical protein
LLAAKQNLLFEIERTRGGVRVTSACGHEANLTLATGDFRYREKSER